MFSFGFGSGEGFTYNNLVRGGAASSPAGSGNPPLPFNVQSSSWSTPLFQRSPFAPSSTAHAAAAVPNVITDFLPHAFAHNDTNNNNNNSNNTTASASPGERFTSMPTVGTGIAFGSAYRVFSSLPFEPASSEWTVRGCPPMSATDIVSTFTLVEAKDSAAAECAICLEVLSGEASGTTRGQAHAEPSPEMNKENNEMMDNAGGKEADHSEHHHSRDMESHAAPLTTSAVVREVYCGHRFHEACILHWISTGRYTCPLCRTPFVYE